MVPSVALCILPAVMASASSFFRMKLSKPQMNSSEMWLASSPILVGSSPLDANSMVMVCQVLGLAGVCLLSLM